MCDAFLITIFKLHLHLCGLHSDLFQHFFAILIHITRRLLIFELFFDGSMCVALDGRVKIVGTTS